MGQRGADARHLVGRDADADARAADQDGAVIGAVHDLRSHPVRQVGIEGVGAFVGAADLGHVEAVL